MGLLRRLPGDRLVLQPQVVVIGKRYRRQDEAGTPLCVTVDFDTVEDGTVTVRDRDAMTQVRVKADDLPAFIGARLVF